MCVCLLATLIMWLTTRMNDVPNLFHHHHQLSCRQFNWDMIFDTPFHFRALWAGSSSSQVKAQSLHLYLTICIELFLLFCFTYQTTLDIKLVGKFFRLIYLKALKDWFVARLTTNETKSKRPTKLAYDTKIYINIIYLLAYHHGHDCHHQGHHGHPQPQNELYIKRPWPDVVAYSKYWKRTLS